MALLNAVIDLSHHNTVTSFDDIKNDGIMAIIHKATQGDAVIDKQYNRRRIGALNAGLLFGSYHFGTDDDPVDQADHYLSVADHTQLMVLDFEPNKHGTMSLKQAEEFIEHIHKKTGKYPGIYSGEFFINQQLGAIPPAGTVLSNCFLWIAKYGAKTPKVPPAFPLFTLWQYTDGNAGPQPHDVQGVGSCDRNKFNGDATGLNKLFG